jgi:hypothetical protein
MKATCKIETERKADATRRPKDESKYYIDYVSKNTTGENFYHQPVRRRDEAILYANRSINNVFVHCFKSGIRAEDVITL